MDCRSYQLFDTKKKGIVQKAINQIVWLAVWFIPNTERIKQSVQVLSDFCEKKMLPSNFRLKSLCYGYGVPNQYS